MDAKSLREKMKEKAHRLAHGDDAVSPDGSSHKPGEKLNADVKTGARPISKRAYKSGGKVEGCEADHNASRAKRKSGGLVNELANTNVKSANEERDGKKHVGGFASGGYSKSAVDKEIGKDKTINAKSANLIRAVLKGRQKSDEPEIAKKSGGPVKKRIGGSATTDYDPSKDDRLSAIAVREANDRASDVASTKLAAEQNALYSKANAEKWAAEDREQGDLTRRKDGGKAERKARKAGGRTNINIIVSPQGGLPKPGMSPVEPPMDAGVPVLPKPPMAPPMHAAAPPPMAPPPPGLGGMHPPMAGGMPPGIPPAPPGAPPMFQRKSGGKVYPIKHGAGGGKGRLEKIEAYGEK